MIAKSIDGAELSGGFVLLRQVLLGSIARPEMNRVPGQN